MEWSGIGKESGGVLLARCFRQPSVSTYSSKLRGLGGRELNKMGGTGSSAASGKMGRTMLKGEISKEGQGGAYCILPIANSPITGLIFEGKGSSRELEEGMLNGNGL